jgi:hypothetical protein
LSSSTVKHHTFIVVLACATLAKLYLAITTQGSIDICAFKDHLEKVRELGVAAYRIRGAFGNPMSHPPPMLHVFKLWGWLADSTAVPFGFWVRLPAILADIGIFYLILRWIPKLKQDKEIFGVLMALAVCPASILISGYHGNTDSVMILLVLLSIYSLATHRPLSLAGTLFGLAISVKIVPLVLAPILFFYLTSWRKRIYFFSFATLVFMLCSLPYLAQDPRAIWAAVFAYKSIYGNWGWSLLATLTFAEAPSYLHWPYDVQGEHAKFAQVLRLLTAGLSCCIAFWMNRRRQKPNLFAQCGIVISLTLFMAPGFGTQYLVWLVPFVTTLNLRFVVIYYLTTGLYLGCVFLCNELSMCVAPSNMIILSMSCWLSVLFVLVGMLGCAIKQTNVNHEEVILRR